MFTPQPTVVKKYFVELPLSRLHVMEAGTGEPLIIVPATISELNEWQSLVQFMAQWFRVYFFELPGHGESTAFEDGFSSYKVAGLVEQLADKLGYERFSLMGFSFGGLLAMRTFKHLEYRIDCLILIAPCLDHRALPLSNRRQKLLYRFNQFLGMPWIQNNFIKLLHNPCAVRMIIKALQMAGRLEDTIPLQTKLPRTRATTISVLNAQIREILTTEFKVEADKHETPCYFAMSIYDPLIRFEETEDILHKHFSQISTVKLYYPYHQPPQPFTYDELDHDFHETVDSFLQMKHQYMDVSSIPMTPIVLSEMVPG